MAVATSGYTTDQMKKFRRYSNQQRSLGRVPSEAEQRAFMGESLAAGADRGLALREQEMGRNLQNRQLGLQERGFKFRKSQGKKELALQRRQAKQQDKADTISGASDLLLGGAGLYNEWNKGKKETPDDVGSTTSPEVTATMGQAPSLGGEGVGTVGDMVVDQVSGVEYPSVFQPTVAHTDELGRLSDGMWSNWFSFGDENQSFIDIFGIGL